MDNFKDIGRLTRDFETRTINTGGKSFSVSTSAIAVQREFKNKEGKYDADFIEIQVWGDGFANKIAPNMKRGNRVYVSGRIQTDRYTAKDGSNRTSFRINCSTCRNLDFNANNGENKNFAPKSEQFTPEFEPTNDFSNIDPSGFTAMDDSEDIPF